MIPAQQVQQAMHAQKGKLALRRVAMARRLPHDRRPGDGEVPHVISGTGEGKHVGDRVLTGVLAVQPAQLHVIRQPHRDCRLLAGHSRRDLWQ